MDIAIFLIVFAGLAAFVLLMTVSSRRDRERRTATKEVVEREQARLEAIRNAMSPAEWELYVVQLEILRVLRKQSKTKSAGYSYGFSVGQGG